jgi:hypothetical protein
MQQLVSLSQKHNMTTCVHSLSNRPFAINLKFCSSDAPLLTNTTPFQWTQLIKMPPFHLKNKTDPVFKIQSILAISRLALRFFAIATRRYLCSKFAIRLKSPLLRFRIRKKNSYPGLVRNFYAHADWVSVFPDRFSRSI